MYSATFDVSRISDIAVTAYLRQSQPNSAAGNAAAGNNNGATGNGGGGGGGADMGNSDLCLGGIRFTPDLESNVSQQPVAWNTAYELDSAFDGRMDPDSRRFRFNSHSGGFQARSGKSGAVGGFMYHILISMPEPPHN